MAGFLREIVKKKAILLTLAVLMMVSLAGCGKKEADKTETVSVSKDYVYKMEDIHLDTEVQNINRLFRAGDAVYAYGYWWSDEGESAIIFYKLNEDGTLEGEYRIPTGLNVGISCINMDDEENIFCIKNDYHPVGAAAEPESEEPVAETYDYEEYMEEYVDDYYLVKMSLTGEELFSVKLNDIPDFAQLGEENGYFYVRDMVLDKKNGVYLSVYGSFMVFDLEGNYIGLLPGNDAQNPWDSVSFLTLEDGRIAAILYEDNGITVAPVDLEKGTIGEKYEIPGASYEYSFYAGKGYDLYLVNSYGVYGFNLGDTDKTQIMNYIDSDFDFYGLYQVIGVGEKDFIATYDDMETGGSVLARFAKVPPEEVKEKQVITLAMANADWGVRRSVIKFNKENDEYRISILDYNSLYGSDSDYKAGINRLNTDIVSGKVPDLVLINYTMPVDSYIGKGLFDDLKPYIEKDPELDLNNFMPNIIEAFSVNGKLYTLVPSYTIETVAAKTSDVGEERGWTVQEAMEVLAAKPEGTQLFVEATRDSIFYYCMALSANQFIDWESGKCSFDSDGFIQMLELIKTFPEEIDYDEMYADNAYWENYDSMWREGKVLGYVFYLGSFRDYNNLEKGRFGEEITLIGFPSANKDGSVISPNLQLALSAKSNKKEGAWMFLRTFLTDEYQEENINYCFPISMKRLNELAEEAMEKPYYYDEKGNKVEYDETYYIGGQEISIPPMTKQETEEFMELLYGFTQVYKQDDTLQNIIEEEAAPYFAGQKSAEDVASIIQSRVQLYVNENR